MALIEARFDEFFRKVAQALHPYHGQVVFIGGCANALYRHHPLARPTSMNPLTTFDLDLATPSKLPAGKVLIHAALAEAGLWPVPANQRTNKFRESPTANETLEFLCPQTSTPRAIRSQSPSLVEIQPKCTAEALDYLDLLLMSPWSIDLKDVPPLAASESLPIHIPNPVSYVMQKVLIRARRGSLAKRAKDCYYIYEIAVLFRNAMPKLTETAGQVAESIHANWRKNFVRLAEDAFGHANADGIQDALRVAGANGILVTPDMIYPAIDRLLVAIKSSSANSSA